MVKSLFWENSSSSRVVVGGFCSPLCPPCLASLTYSESVSNIPTRRPLMRSTGEVSSTVWDRPGIWEVGPVTPLVTAPGFMPAMNRELHPLGFAIATMQNAKLESTFINHYREKWVLPPGLVRRWLGTAALISAEDMKQWFIMWNKHAKDVTECIFNYF